jgi:hypothetical protein
VTIAQHLPRLETAAEAGDGLPELAPARRCCIKLARNATVDRRLDQRGPARNAGHIM